MKDFAEEYLKHEDIDKETDPYLFFTPEVQEELLEIQASSFSNLSASHLLSVMLTAPLTTITASLQLSVKPHKTIMEEPVSKSTQVSRINTALTLQEKRKMELMLRTGGQQRPYTAPVYEGYRAVIRGLSAQGWQGFFKGFFFRSIHQSAHFLSWYEVGMLNSNDRGLREGLSIGGQLIKIWFLQCACDISLNMFQMAENRYILQNRINEFRVFRNGSKVIRKMVSRKEIFRGINYHFFNNTIETFVRMPFYLAFMGHINETALIGIYLTELIIYPFNTAFRRILCQQPTIPGMIPLRYSGIFHAIRLIPQQEGIKGLYKGFGLHHVTLGVRLACLKLFGTWLVDRQISQ